jgi:hypothetical protein
VLPYLKKKYLKYADYKLQTVDDIFTKEQLSQAVKLEAYEMRSSVFINQRNGTFKMQPLPTEAQLSVMYGATVTDIDGDGIEDIVMGGNFYQSKPEAGIYDASYGVVLKGNGKGGFTAMRSDESGVNIRGAVRDVVPIQIKNEQTLLFALNNEKPRLYILPKKKLK